jgi:tRNA dimethylallyltransferase
VADEVDRRGVEAAHARLTTRAPGVAAAIATTDRQRVTRALELIDSGLSPPSGDGGELWTTDTRHPTRLIGLVRDRAELHALIDGRVDHIVAAGAAGAAAGASESVRRAVGFAELMDDDVETMKTRTRRYARRQLTWMRKLPAIELVSLTGTSVADAARAVVQD